MEAHNKWIQFILSDPVSVSLSVLAFLLAFLYLLDFLFLRNRSRRIITEGLLVRIVNWSIFGLVFLLFGQIIQLKDLLTWRALARMALMSLILSEMAFQIVTMWPATKRKLWKRET